LSKIVKHNFIIITALEIKFDRSNGGRVIFELSNKYR